jgi:hypothetical protein
MKKDFRVLSDRKCEDCGKQLKQNLIDIHPDAKKCFKHWVLAKIPHMKYKRLHLKGVTL